MDHSLQNDADPRPSNRTKWVLIGFLLIAGFFLFSEHRAHLLGFLPFLLFLACPLMHLFHHGHRRHGNNAPSQGEVRQEQSGEKR